MGGWKCLPSPGHALLRLVVAPPAGRGAGVGGGGRGAGGPGDGRRPQTGSGPPGAPEARRGRGLRQPRGWLGSSASASASAWPDGWVRPPARARARTLRSLTFHFCSGLGASTRWLWTRSYGPFGGGGPQVAMAVGWLAGPPPSASAFLFFLFSFCLSRRESRSLFRFSRPRQKCGGLGGRPRGVPVADGRGGGPGAGTIRWRSRGHRPRPPVVVWEGVPRSKGPHEAEVIERWTNPPLDDLKSSVVAFQRSGGPGVRVLLGGGALGLRNGSSRVCPTRSGRGPVGRLLRAARAQ